MCNPRQRAAVNLSTDIPEAFPEQCTQSEYLEGSMAQVNARIDKGIYDLLSQYSGVNRGAGIEVHG